MALERHRPATRPDHHAGGIGHERRRCALDHHGTRLTGRSADRSTVRGAVKQLEQDPDLGVGECAALDGAGRELRRRPCPRRLLGGVLGGKRRFGLLVVRRRGCPARGRTPAVLTQGDRYGNRRCGAPARRGGRDFVIGRVTAQMQRPAEAEGRVEQLGGGSV